MQADEERAFRELAWALGVLSPARARRLAQYHVRLLHEESRMLELEEIIDLYAACSRISTQERNHAESPDA
jgi:hypothetical protein